tara:strand:- start:3035 stop:3361 length:327 start_codon:yes stop_codon:yes gene_type:complete
MIKSKKDAMLRVISCIATPAILASLANQFIPFPTFSATGKIKLSGITRNHTGPEKTANIEMKQISREAIKKMDDFHRFCGAGTLWSFIIIYGSIGKLLRQHVRWRSKS